MGKTLSRRSCWGSLLAVGLVSGSLLGGSRGAQFPVVAAPQPGPGMGWGPMGLQQVDQRFIVMMIPHHDGAIAMAELALTRAKRPQIKTLAQQIKASQIAENEQMRAWYRQWFGSEVPAWQVGGRGHGMGMGRGRGMGMGGGMMGMETSLAALRSASDFDRAFIEQMIPHHRMGVMMASHAQWNTQRSELRTLQAAMVKAQSEEIAQMEQWYRQWYGASAS
jgi:uncharacterized protein (DUF305 family)